ncbi:MAG: imidazole glycerol phosphate synthase subunit HisH [Betaproteobacteria bacterium]|jgi:glutamine amidotransferase|nr:imidazole glycerol phosphate synthase subunit HisH [Betaproteobacteria bacterium]
MPFLPPKEACNHLLAIVDYGSGNLRSVERAAQAALAHLGENPEGVALVSDPDQLRRADRVIFPGQGSMNDCMEKLAASGLMPALQEVIRNKPFLGICVGEQMLFEASEERDTPGLGILPGQVLRFTAARGVVDAQGRPLKVPHMGWNKVRFVCEHPVIAGLHAPTGAWFYFVHSYHAEPTNPEHVLGTSDYGISFTCAVASDNIVATQFHPEKSAQSGLRLLANFLQWSPV